MSSPAVSRPEKANNLTRRWRAVRLFTDARLTEITEDLPFSWHVFLVVAFLIALVMAAMLHILQVLALRSDNEFVATIGIAPAILAAAMLLSLVTWAYWRTHKDQTDTRPYVIALLATVLVIAVCIEAFAGVTTIAWQQGTFGSASSLDLWTAERHYIWQFLDGIPLLRITETLHWDQPIRSPGANAGVLALIFKLVLVVPLLGLADSGYRFFEARRLHKQDELRDKELRDKRAGRSPQHVWRSDAGDAWAFAGKVGVLTTIALAGIAALFEPGFLPDRWLTEVLPDNMAVGGIEVPFEWFHTAPQIVVIAILLWLGRLFIDDLMLETFPTNPHSKAAVFGGISMYVLLLVFVTGVMAAVNLALLHLQVAAAEPKDLADGQVLAAFSWFAWHAADVIPILEIPSTLGLTPNSTFVDVWSGGLLLIYQTIVLAVLFIGIPRVVVSYIHYIRVRPVEAGLLSAARTFAGQLEKVRAAQDDAERAVVNRRGSRDPRRSARSGIGAPISFGGARPMGSGRSLAMWPDWFASYPLIRAARDELLVLTTALRPVGTLFGGGPVSDAARAALIATEDRMHAIEKTDASWRSARFAVEGTEGKDSSMHLQDARAATVAAAKTFVHEAKAALRREAQLDSGARDDWKRGLKQRIRPSK